MNQQNNKPERWTEEQDNILLHQIDVFPHNMSRSFFMAAQTLTDMGHPRTKGACAARWYTVLSKQPGIVKFATISKHSLAKNRKNGMGVEISGNIWHRFLTLVRSFID